MGAISLVNSDRGLLNIEIRPGNVSTFALQKPAGERGSRLRRTPDVGGEPTLRKLDSCRVNPGASLE
jgi:hypothetical protein